MNSYLNFLWIPQLEQLLEDQLIQPVNNAVSTFVHDQEQSWFDQLYNPMLLLSRDFLIPMSLGVATGQFNEKIAHSNMAVKIGENS